MNLGPITWTQLLLAGSLVVLVWAKLDGWGMMPYSVRKTKRKGKPWAIVNTRTGKVAGYSASKGAARTSASIRNRAHK